MNKTILFLILVFFSIFGIIFLSLLFHEGIHVVQSEAPISICYDFQQKTMMHVFHNTSEICDGAYYKDKDVCQKELDEFELYTEKWAHLGQAVLQSLLFIVLGFVICLILHNRKLFK